MNIDSLSLLWLLVIFAGAAIAIWIAGIKLADTTDVLVSRFGFGEAMGGLIILAIVTNLPEIAIVTAASLQHKMGIAIGNILGGIAIQTVVLVVLDRFGLGKSSSLTYKASSLVLVLEGTLVIAVLALVIAGHELPAKIIFWRITPPGLLIFIFWAIEFCSSQRHEQNCHGLRISKCRADKQNRMDIHVRKKMSRQK